MTNSEPFPKRPYEIYTDGGYSMGANKGAFAYIVIFNGSIVARKAIPVENETNNRCELYAIQCAVRELPKGSSATIYTDSQYSIGVFGGKYRATKNTDIIIDFKRYVRENELKLNYVWVKGHSGIKWNEECDRMCNEASGLNLNEISFRRDDRSINDIPIMSDIELMRLYSKVCTELKERKLLF